MKSKVLAFVMAAVILVMTACSTSGNTAPTSNAGAENALKPIAKEDIKAGFLYVGPIGDEGYSYAHDQGRLALEKKLGVKTMYVENVPENADCEKAIRDLIDQGCNVIFSTSFGHMDWTLNVAKEFPNVYFHHCSGYKTADNMSNYFGRMYEARYLSGIAAGLKTKTNKIGYVAAMPIAEVVRGANAFALGVKSVNPDAKVEVKWTNSWYDPALEKQTAIDLLNSGCDVLGQHCDTTAPQLAANEAGKFAVGYNASTLSAAPKAYLTSPIWNWGQYYISAVESIIDGTWKSESYWGHMSEGICYLDELSANCEPGTKEAIEAASKKMAAGELHPFAGPIKDNQGNELVKSGEVMSDADMLSIMSFVDNIIGTVPKN